MSLAGKVALVTGGSNGIGKACVERLAREGASVVINYNRDATSAEALVSAIGRDRALPIQADVSSITGIENLVDESVKKFGKIDIVMANAGVMPMRTVETATVEDFDNCFDMNVKGPYFLAQVSSPLPTPPHGNAADIRRTASDPAHAGRRAHYIRVNKHLPCFRCGTRLPALCS